jgi:hypothetical protein
MAEQATQSTTTNDSEGTRGKNVFFCVLIIYLFQYNRTNYGYNNEGTTNKCCG